MSECFSKQEGKLWENRICYRVAPSHTAKECVTIRHHHLHHHHHRHRHRHRRQQDRHQSALVIMSHVQGMRGYPSSLTTASKWGNHMETDEIR